MDKGKQLIMVVRRQDLFGKSNEYFFKNFSSHGEGGEADYKTKIRENFQWQERGLVENNPDFRQPIAYTMIINTALKKVFAYQRARKDKDYGERRLQGRWAWGVGGHVDKGDLHGASKDPIENSLLRELGREEVEFVDGKTPGLADVELLGYINDVSDDVGSVHFGLLYVARTDAEIILPKDKEISEGGLRKLGELDEILSTPDCTVENWSVIAFGPLTKSLIDL